MGGPLKRNEPKNCYGIRDNEKIWELFQNVGFTPFFWALKGYNKALTAWFYNSWKNGVVTIGSISFMVIPYYISKVTDLPNDGVGVERHNSGDYKQLMKKIFEKGEKPKAIYNGYGRLALPKLFPIVSYYVIKYFMPEGRYTTMHGHHFLILNHIRNGEKVNLPFFLFSSLESCIQNVANPPLHQGFIYFLYKFIVDHSPSLNSLSPILGNEENPQKNLGTSSKLVLLIPMSHCSLRSTSFAKNRVKKTLSLLDKESLEISLLNVKVHKKED